MSWVWILFIGMIFAAIAIIVLIIVFSGSNNSSGQKPSVDDGDGGTPGTGGGEGGTDTDPEPPAPSQNGATCTANADCKENNCSNGYCQPGGKTTGNEGAVCSSSGPSCNTGIICVTSVNGLGTCTPTTEKYGATCDNVKQLCNLPYVCTSGTCQFNVPTTACVNTACSSGFTCVNNVCEAQKSQFCTSDDNCLSTACNITIYGNRFVIDSSNSNYLSWVPSLNPIPSISSPAFISQLEVTSDRSEAWMYIGTNTLQSGSTTDPNNSLRAIQYWNASLNRWSLAQPWKYDNIHTFPNGAVMSGILRGITLAPSNKCYALFDLINSSNTSGIYGFGIFRIIPIVSNSNVSFSLVPYNSSSSNTPGLQASLSTNISNVTAVSSTTYQDNDYMIIYAYIYLSGGAKKTPYIRDINNLAFPYYISSGLYLETNTPNIFPTYYFAPSSVNPLLDFTTVNYGDSNNIVSLTYTGTINRTVSGPSINNTTNQFVTYRHCQINGKAALVMIYSKIITPSTPVVSTLAINYDVANNDSIENFPGYITSNPTPPLAVNVDALYVINPSRCN